MNDKLTIQKVLVYDRRVLPARYGIRLPSIEVDLCHACACMHMCMHTRAHVVYVYMYVCIYTYIYTYINIHTFTEAKYMKNSFGKLVRAKSSEAHTPYSTDTQIAHESF
jgi:hypothetical protein